MSEVFSGRVGFRFGFMVFNATFNNDIFLFSTGADPGFQVRGGALKEIFWVFRVKNHDFTQKKSYFFQLRREARNFWGISCEKSPF